MESKIIALKSSIHEAFKGVELGEGISWREADVIDDYGSNQQRQLARAQDEQKDWTQIPLSLIGDLRYQSVLSFLDSKGFKFYLPICMIYVLDASKTSGSAIIDSLFFDLLDSKKIEELKKVLDKNQMLCVRDFLTTYLELGVDYIQAERIYKALKNDWTL